MLRSLSVGVIDNQSRYKLRKMAEGFSVPGTSVPGQTYCLELKVQGRITKLCKAQAIICGICGGKLE